MFALNPGSSLRHETFRFPTIPECKFERSERSAFRRWLQGRPVILSACSSGANSFRISTYEEYTRNPFRIRTSKTKDLKPLRMNTYKKRGEGVAFDKGTDRAHP